MKGIKSHNGFTIVELIVVVVIIALLAAISIVSYNGITQQARQSAAASTLRSLNDSIQAYSISHKSTLPETLTEANISASVQSTTLYWPISGSRYCLSTSSQGTEYRTTSDDVRIVVEGSCNEISWVAGQPLAFSQQTGSSTPLRTPVGPGQNVTVYSVFSITNADFGYSSLGGLGPGTTGSRFYFQGATSGSLSAGYRIDTSTNTNLTGSQGNVRTPGRHIGWLQSSSNATVRSFGFDRITPQSSTTLDGGAGWNLTQLEVPGTSSSFAGVAGVAYDTAHDQETRQSIMNWLARKYSTNQSF